MVLTAAVRYGRRFYFSSFNPCAAAAMAENIKTRRRFVALGWHGARSGAVLP